MAKTKSTRRKALVRVVRVEVPKPAVAEPVVETVEQLAIDSDTVQLRALGLQELKATPEEEAILARAPHDDDIQVLPTEDGALYLPHHVYTLWFNEAFGRGGWTLVPADKPALIQGIVTRNYVFCVHGRSIVHAQGQQEYHENNRNQNYGDALEGTVGSALRRCAKHLAIGWQLWDRQWCNRWRAQHCVRMTVMKNKKQADGSWKAVATKEWRRKDEPRDEAPQQPGPQPVAKPAPPPATHKLLDKPISEARRERFWRTARRVGRTDYEVKVWLESCYKLKQSADMINRDYDTIMAVLEASGPLPTCTETIPAAEREPGEDG